MTFIGEFDGVRVYEDPSVVSYSVPGMRDQLRNCARYGVYQVSLSEKQDTYRPVPLQSGQQVWAGAGASTGGTGHGMFDGQPGGGGGATGCGDMRPGIVVISASSRATSRGETRNCRAMRWEGESVKETEAAAAGSPNEDDCCDAVDIRMHERTAADWGPEEWARAIIYLAPEDWDHLQAALAAEDDR